MADACIFMMNNYNPTPEANDKWEIYLNIWTWEDLTKKELAEKMRKIIWYEWEIKRDTSKPNWTQKKLLDVSKLKELWWKYQVRLDEGIRDTYECFLSNY
jgi:GDP-L-fucose synthase